MVLKPHLILQMLYDGPFLDLQVPTLTVTQTGASVGDGTQAALDIADVIWWSIS